MTPETPPMEHFVRQTIGELTLRLCQLEAENAALRAKLAHRENVPEGAH